MTSFNIKKILITGFELSPVTGYSLACRLELDSFDKDGFPEYFYFVCRNPNNVDDYPPKTIIFCDDMSPLQFGWGPFDPPMHLRLQLEKALLNTDFGFGAVTTYGCDLDSYSIIESGIVPSKYIYNPKSVALKVAYFFGIFIGASIINIIW